MKKIISTTIFLMASVIMAPFAHSQNAVKPILGFSEGAVNFGVDYEHALDSSTGVGGFFHFSSKDDDTGKAQVISFGGMMPVHFTNENKYFDTYLAPGFAINMVDTAVDDKTVIGPVVKLGFMYRLSADLKVGIDHLHIVNWFEDSLVPNISFTNAAMSIAF